VTHPYHLAILAAAGTSALADGVIQAAALLLGLAVAGRMVMGRIDRLETKIDRAAEIAAELRERTAALEAKVKKES
jgi:hypothetical protein